MVKSTSFFIVGTLVGIVAAGGLFSWVGQSKGTAATGVQTLKVAHSLPMSHPVHKGLEEFKRLLVEMSGGKMDVAIFPSEQLGTETQCLEKVQAGTLDITKVSAAAIGNFVPTGLLIPPSNVMIVYAVVASNVSISALFIAGVIPGIVIGLLIMAVALIVSRENGYGDDQEQIEGEVRRSALVNTWRALPSLLLVVFVLGGILTGWFTPTEASAVAVLWAFILAVLVYREVPFKALPKIAIGSARTTGIVMLLVAVSQAMSGLLTEEQVPRYVSEALLGFSSNPLMILLTINIILLVVGTCMDMTPAVLVFTPIFLPVAVGIGIDPVHFGMILIANLCIGLCTPPVGTCLFLGCSVGKSNIARVSVAMLPFYAAMFVGLILITYWPPLSLWLPKLFGVMD